MFKCEGLDGDIVMFPDAMWKFIKDIQVTNAKILYKPVDKNKEI